MATPALRWPARSPDGKVGNGVIATPKRGRNTCADKQGAGRFRLGGVLLLGAIVACAFGLVPSSLGGDGEPLDVLVQMDVPVCTGCLVSAPLLGGIEAQQTEGGE